MSPNVTHHHVHKGSPSRLAWGELSPSLFFCLRYQGQLWDVIQCHILASMGTVHVWYANTYVSTHTHEICKDLFRIGEMAQQLRGHTAAPEDLSLTPSR